MGLFSNNKKLCPVCGNPTPRLLATKIQDTPICKECDKKIYLQKGRTDRMTIDDFKQYIQFYEDNQALRDQFEENYSFNFGLFGGDLVLDIFHGLFRVNCDKDSLAFDMYPKFWTHIYKLSGHHGCFSVFYRRHPFCFCLNPFVIIVINILTYSNCKFFK